MKYVMFCDIPWFPESAWVVPVIGVVVCLLAFLVGWRLLVGHTDNKVDPNQPLDTSFLKGVVGDRRSCPRRKGNTVEVQLVGDKENRAIAGWVLDRSQGGLCLLVDQSIAEGAILRVRPRKASTATPWTEIIVRSCREEAGQFELGCQFPHPPNWSLLLMFG